MHLQDCETFIVANPPPSFGGRYFIFVKLVTSNGIVGYGEVYAGQLAPEVMCAVVGDVFARHCDGASPFDREAMGARAYSSGFSQRPDPTVLAAWSGIEIACSDIIGKALEQPVHTLIGGMVHERVRAYTYLYPGPGDVPADFYNDPDASAERAAELVEEGWTAIKFDPAGPYTIHDPHQPAMADISRSVAFCAKIREAVGDRADLLFGTHGQFTPSGAIRMGHAIAPYRPLWFEEPVPPDVASSLAKVVAGQPVPLAAGERLTSLHEFARLLEADVSILQPALGRCGGIGEACKIAALAKAHHAQIAPHLYAGPIEAAANVQLAASQPNLLLMESIGTMGGFHAELLDRPIRIEEGHAIPSTEPGLGHDLDEDVARANPWTGEQLHLEMQDTPYDYSRESRFGGG